VWQALGDVDHYVEPFAGSLAVLLGRPHPCNRPYYSETVNDLDGFVVNAWRAMQFHPEETARHASWPVMEADKTARQIAVVKWRDERVLDLLAGSPEWCDPKMAGWWLWGVCAQIGTIGGPWTSDPVSGRIVKQGRGVRRGLPHLTGDGQGVNRPGTREPGVSALDALGVDGYHDVAMPELIRWFRHLSARLRHVRVLNGDWQRAVTGGASKTLSVLQGGTAGVFLDPPYDTAERSATLYGHESVGDSLSAACRQWCLDHGDDPQFRIVLAGYDTEHVELEEHGWSVVEWFKAGHLRGGMGNIDRSGKGHQQHRERLWLSPHCLGAEEPAFTELTLWEDE